MEICFASVEEEISGFKKILTGSKRKRGLAEKKKGRSEEVLRTSPN